MPRSLVSAARYDLIGIDLGVSRIARLHDDEPAKPTLGQGSSLKQRKQQFRSTSVLLLYQAPQGSYSGARETLFTRVVHMLDALVRSVHVNAAPGASTLDVLQTSLSARVGSTGAAVIRSDHDDVVYQRADGRIVDRRNRLTGATVEFL